MRIRTIVGLVRASACALAVLAPAAPAAAQGCPPSSHEVSQTEANGVVRVACRCDAGYAKVDAACKPVHEARAQLATRLRDALRGAESSLASLRDELKGEVYEALKAKIVPALTAIATAIATKQVTLLARTGGAAVLALLAVVAEGGTDMKECTYSTEDARTACRNANRFKEIAESSQKAFEATFP